MAPKKTSSGTASELTRKADKSKPEKIQAALYQIADAASAMTDMQEFYAALHRIVRELMYAENFYVTLYDPATQIMSAPYFADEAGDAPPPPSRLEDYSKSLRAHVLRTGKTLHVSGEQIEEGKQRGVFEPMGTPAEDWVGVPLKIGGQTIGSLTIQSYQKDVRYTEQDVQLLEFVAQHIAVALNRARAIDETRQRNAELGIINAVQSALAAKLDIHGIYDIVGEKLREIFNVHTLAIFSADLKSKTVRWEYDIEKGQKFPPMELPFNSLFEYVLNLNETLVLNGDFPQFAAKFKDYKVLGNVIPKSVLIAPVIRKNESNQVVSICLFDIDSGKIFTDTDVRLVETIANAMSVALENARLFDETQHLLKETEQRNAELAIINSVQEGLASRLAIQAIYDLVGDRLRDVFHNMDVGIRIYDVKTNIIHNPYTYENGQRIDIGSFPLPERGFGPHALRTLENVVINENMIQEMEKYGSKKVPGTEISKSLLMVPLVVNDRAHGLITISDIKSEHAFKESDVRLLETLANSMSVALENARLWEEEKKYRRALERELEIGREIQAGFLPEALPQVEGWEIAAMLMSAREVAGDFYDAFELPDGNIALVIADVCDKGVGAALFMTLFRSLIRITSNLEYFEHTGGTVLPHSTPERLKRALSLTNNYIAETHGDSGMFATLFFGILDPRDGKLAYINGGHEPPLILRSGLVRETLCKTGPAVGAVTDGHFELLESYLKEGDTFFAFTDGVPDSIDLRGESFGRERLHEVLRRNNAPAHELVRAAEAELRQFIGSGNQFDDITLLAVKRLGGF